MHVLHFEEIYPLKQANLPPGVKLPQFKNPWFRSFKLWRARFSIVSSETLTSNSTEKKSEWLTTLQNDKKWESCDAWLTTLQNEKSKKVVMDDTQHYNVHNAFVNSCRLVTRMCQSNAPHVWKIGLLKYLLNYRVCNNYRNLITELKILEKYLQ